MKLRIGTRGSALALAQATWTQARLREVTGEQPEIVIVRTSGDRVQDVALRTFGGVGVFTKEIDEGQRAGAFDISVHSLKDLPTTGREGLLLTAVPVRAPVEDCLVARDATSLETLRHGARIGSGSPRRRAQLLAVRGDFAVEEIRGNVDTRLRKVKEGAVDATLLARAGLVRLGLAAEITQVIPTETMLPAAGQGALALVVREGCDAAAAAVRSLEDRGARAEIDAERAVLGTLGGGCHLPLGCLGRADLATGRLTLRARVVAPDGIRKVDLSDEGDLDDASAIGARLGARLIAAGARELLPTA